MQGGLILKPSPFLLEEIVQLPSHPGSGCPAALTGTSKEGREEGLAPPEISTDYEAGP